MEGMILESEIIEKWYDLPLSREEELLRMEYRSNHKFQLHIAIKRLWKSGECENVR